MFSAKLITICFIGMFMWPMLHSWLLKINNINILQSLLKTTIIVSILCCIYCLFAGLSMVSNWSDILLVPKDTQTIATTSTRRGGGLVMLIIEYWPYCLSGLSGYFLYHYCILYRFIKK